MPTSDSMSFRGFVNKATNSIIKIFFFLSILFVSTPASGQTLYHSISELKANAKSGDEVYLDIDYCVYITSPLTLIANLNNPDEFIEVSSLGQKDITQAYHGIYGKYMKTEVECYISSKNAPTDFSYLVKEGIDKKALTILPKEILSGEVDNMALHEYVRLKGQVSIPIEGRPEYAQLISEGKLCSIQYPASLIDNSRYPNMVVEGVIKQIEKYTNTSTKIPEWGVYVINIWNPDKEKEIPDRNVKVNVAEEDAGMGTVSVAEKGTETSAAEANIKDGATAVLKAVPATGYEFSQWKLNGVPYPDAESAKQAEMEWTVIGNAAFEAHFLKKEAVPTYIINATSNDEALGEAKVTTLMPVEQGTKVALEATPKDGIARFVNWTNQDNEIVSTEATAEIEATANMTLTANFVAIGSVSAVTEGEGSVVLSQGGTTLSADTKIDKGSKVTVTATPDEGWELKEITFGTEKWTVSPAEVTVNDFPAEINVVFDKLPEPEPEPLPESVETVADLRKYAADGVEMSLTCPLTIIAPLLSSGSEFLVTDGQNVLIGKTQGDHPAKGSVITDVRGKYGDMGSGILYFKIDQFTTSAPQEAKEITPIETSVAQVMSLPGEYVTISNVRIGPASGNKSNNQSYFMVYGKIDSSTEPPVLSYYDFEEVGPTELDRETYYTVTGVVGDIGREQMFILTEPPVLQAKMEDPRISLTPSPSDGGRVWIEVGGEAKGTTAQVAANTTVTLCAEAAEGMEFAGWIATGSDEKPSGEAKRAYKVTVTASFTAVFTKKTTEPETPENPEPEQPTPPSAKSFKVTFSVSDNGTVTVVTPDGALTSGAMVVEGTKLTITTRANDGYHLSELKINGASRSVDDDGVCTATVTAATVIEAVFTRTVASAKQLRVAVDDWIEGVEMGKVYIDNPGTTYLESAMLIDHEFHAEPANDCRFVGWRVKGADTPFNTSPVFTYTVREPLTLIAEFAYIIPAPRTVEVRANSSEKGTVIIKEFDDTKATTRRYITLSATPAASNHTFRDWTDEEGNVISTEPEFIYTSALPAVLTANFTSTYSLTLTAVGPGSLDWKATGEEDAALLPEDTRVTITAEPETHYELSGLTVNGTDMTDKFNEANGELTIVMNGDKEVNATFTPIAYTVTIGQHAHGRIEVKRGVNGDGTPAGGAVAHNDRVRYGDILHIYPIAADGYRLTEVRVNGLLADHDPEKGYAAHAVEGDAAITADFEAIPTAIDSISADDNPEAELFDLQGRPAGKLSSARPGLYLMRRASGWVKILIR